MLNRLSPKLLLRRVLASRRVVRVPFGPLRGVAFPCRKNIPIRVMLFGYYERRCMSHVLKLVQPGMTVLDIGANIGLYTLLFAKIVGRSGRVIAVEPIENLARQIRLTLEMNGYTNTVVEEVVITSVDGTAKLQIAHDQTDSWPQQEGVLLHADIGPSRGFVVEEVPTLSVDSLIRRCQLSRLDFIKMDIEGAEVIALDGATHTLETLKPAILVECHGSYERVAERLLRIGYVYRVIDGAPGREHILCTASL